MGKETRPAVSVTPTVQLLYTARIEIAAIAPRRERECSLAPLAQERAKVRRKLVMHFHDSP
jgi:hypothetical protein